MIKYKRYGVVIHPLSAGGGIEIKMTFNIVVEINIPLFTLTVAATVVVVVTTFYIRARLKSSMSYV